jgi:hypothetical protein
VLACRDVNAGVRLQLAAERVLREDVTGTLHCCALPVAVGESLMRLPKTSMLEEVEVAVAEAAVPQGAAGPQGAS